MNRTKPYQITIAYLVLQWHKMQHKVYSSDMILFQIFWPLQYSPDPTPNMTKNDDTNK